MKNFWITLGRGSAASFLLATLFITSSMCVLAATPKDKLAGELTVTGNNTDPAAVVTINDERAFSGRSVFPFSTIVTPEGAGATISLGETGRIELAPNTNFSLSFTDKTISGTLGAGQIKIFNSAGVETKIQTKDKTVISDVNQNNLFAVDVQSGMTTAFAENGAISVSNGKNLAQQQQDNPTGGSGASTSGSIIAPLAIFVGIVAVAVIYVVTKDDDGNNVIVSPVR